MRALVKLGRRSSSNCVVEVETSWLVVVVMILSWKEGGDDDDVEVVEVLKTSLGGIGVDDPGT
jgi:hypothetical protein